MAGRLSFKKQPRETGLSAIGNPYASVDVKLDGLICGMVSVPSRFGHDHWKIRLIVKDAEQKCGWRWVFLKGNHADEAAAREFLVKNWDTIKTKFELTSYETEKEK